MTDDGFDGRPARTTALVAAFVAAATVVTVGWAVGLGRTASLVVVGSAVLAAGTWGLAESDRRRQAGGSVAAVAGSGLLFGLLVTGAGSHAGFVAVALVVGTPLVAVDAAVGFDGGRIQSVTSVLSGNVKLLVLGGVAITVLSVTLVFGLLQALFGGLVALSTVTPLAGFVTLQLFALCVALALPRAVWVLESWTGDDDGDRDGLLRSVETAGLRVRDVPRVYWAALGVQLLAALSTQANALFNPVLGVVLGPLLTSGVLHGLLLLALVAVAAVFAGLLLEQWAVAWFGPVPAQTAAVQAGGFTSILAAVLVGLVVEYAPDSPVGDLVGPLALANHRLVVVPVALLIGLVVALVAVSVALEVGPGLARLRVVPGRATGFALGSGLIVLATVRAATLGVPPLVVFGGVAGALLTWDVGSHAASVGAQLGRDADARRSELVHATGSTLVLAGAVAFAALARYVVVPAAVPTATSGTAGVATLAMTLVLVAVLAFVAAVHLRGGPPDA